MHSTPTWVDLFEQLGLDGSEQAIATFIQQHQLAAADSISTAIFWTPAQRAFLQQCYQHDAEWVALVDELNAKLHQPAP